MSSIIEIVVVSEHGDTLTAQRLTIGYGDENQRVVVILSDPAIDHSSDLMDVTARDALNESMAEQLSMVEGYDA